MGSDAFKNTGSYRNQLRRLINEAVIEKVDPEVGTFPYFQLNHGNSSVVYIRIFNKEEGLVYLINEESFEKKLKYMDTELFEFYDRLETIGFTLYW